VIKRLN